ncbi:hypothetical protein [Allopusillimonas ginsengisoli]|nr:hypothetical protein [Allopusillimonas ginsengisoli]
MRELVKHAQELPQDIIMHGKSVAVMILRAAFDHPGVSLINPRHTGT